MKRISMAGKLAVVLFMLIGVALPAQAKNAMRIVINNHLGAPEMLVDENQHVVWQAEYDEFGKANILVEEVEFNQRLPGQYYDKETGLSYNYYRDYDPSFGRYVQSDPIGLKGGINTYAYSNGNPIMFIDPKGLSGYGFGNVGNIAGISGQMGGAGAAASNSTTHAVGVVVGIGDFSQAYIDQWMSTNVWGNDGKSKGWSGQDKYFHCRANCEAAQRGSGGESAAQCLSDVREGFDQGWPKYDSAAQSAADQVANHFGRSGGAANTSGNCQQICGPYRPGGTFPAFL